MAQETFAQIWNKVLLYAPNLPVPLAQQMVKDTYISVLNSHEWSETMKETEITLATEYATGSVTATNGSTTVALATGTVTTDWNNTRQLGIFTNQGYAPFYDIVSVNTTANTMTLDRAYAGASTTAGSYIVAQYFVEMPSNFHVGLDVRDATRNWRLRRMYHQASYLDRIDARRQYAGTPILYVQAQPRITSGVSYPRFEFWPRIPSGTKLIWRYIEQNPLSASTDYPITVVSPRVLVYGALALACLWPGSAERPNPYFSLDNHREYNKLYEELLQEAVIKDQNRAQNFMSYAEDDRGYPADARFIQEHGLA